MIILVYPIKIWIGTCEDYHKGILFSTNQYQKQRHKFLEHRSIRFIFLCWLNYAVCLLGSFKSSENFACGFWEDPRWPIFDRLLKRATRRFSGRCVSTVSAVLAHKCQKGLLSLSLALPQGNPSFATGPSICLVGKHWPRHSPMVWVELWVVLVLHFDSHEKCWSSYTFVSLPMFSLWKEPS